MRKIIAITILGILIGTTSIDVKANERVDTIINEMEIEDSEMTSLEFLNAITKKLNLKSGYETIYEFNEYAKEHYAKIDPYHIENGSRVWNTKIIEQSDEIIIIITGHKVYLVNNNKVTSVGEEKYKNYEVNLLDIINETSNIYIISPILSPLDEIVINDNYGYRTDPINGGSAFHSGVDLRASIGTNIYATEKGKVKSVIYSDSGYGYHIEIEHENGKSTLYAHCSELLVQEGQNVNAGDLIAKAGSTGRSTGSHLHFEYRENGESKDPMKYIEGGN